MSTTVSYPLQVLTPVHTMLLDTSYHPDDDYEESPEPDTWAVFIKEIFPPCIFPLN